MSRSFIAAFVLALSAIALPAAADEAKGAKPNFPVAAAEFAQHVDARLEKKKARLEQAIVEKNIPAEKAQAMRAHFEENAGKIRAEVAKVGADGVVTKEEAKEVHDLARSLDPHHHDKGQTQPPA